MSSKKSKLTKICSSCGELVSDYIVEDNMIICLDCKKEEENE